MFGDRIPNYPKGQFRSLTVVVRRYSPFVDCSPAHGQPPAMGSCSRVTDNIPVDPTVKTFGTRFRPADVITPKHFRAGKCDLLMLIRNQ